LGIFRSVREKWLGVIWLMDWGMAEVHALGFQVVAEIERRPRGASRDKPAPTFVAT